MMLEKAYGARDKGRDGVEEKRLANVMVKGVAIGMEGLIEDLKGSMGNLEKFMESLGRAQKRVPKAEEFLMDDDRQ